MIRLRLDAVQFTFDVERQSNGRITSSKSRTASIVVVTAVLTSDITATDRASHPRWKGLPSAHQSALFSYFSTISQTSANVVRPCNSGLVRNVVSCVELTSQLFTGTKLHCLVTEATEREKLTGAHYRSQLASTEWVSE